MRRFKIGVDWTELSIDGEWCLWEEVKTLLDDKERIINQLQDHILLLETEIWSTDDK